MPPTGILHTEMDENTLLELEIQQDLDRLNLDNDNIIADDDNDEELPVVVDDVLVSEDEGLPAELQDYIDTIQKQRHRFEEELEECDAVIERALSTARGEGDGEKAVIVYDEWKELEEEATRHGMSVEEYRKKLLQDIEDEPFELEEMDFITDDSDFVLPESSLDKLLKAPEATQTSIVLADHPLRADQEPSNEDVMIEKALKIARAMEAEQRRKMEEQGGEAAGALIPVTGVPGSSSGEGGADAGQLVPVSIPDTEGHPHQAPVVPGSLNVDEDDEKEGDNDCVASAGKDKDDGGTTEPVTDNLGSSESDTNTPGEETAVGTMALIHSNPLLEFEQYLRQQFQLAEERFRQRELQLKQELEARREVEEKLMLAMEQHKLQTMHSLQQEEQRLAHQKQESQKKLDQEIEKQQKVLEKELQQHEETIATLTTQLEEDRYQLEKVQRAEEERLAQRDGKAATTIQRCYKGYRARKLHQSERQTLAERREQRKEEKQQQRIQEVEQEIQQRKEEEERKTEEARRAKEEEERKIAEEKQRQEEEEHMKKEEEERKKKEEEERKRKVEEEKKRKEEEERCLREEQERRKQEEEERQRKEEEDRKRREEEERKQKEEEERKRKEEEEERKRKEEEDRQRIEEEERKRREEEEKQKKEEEERKKREEEQKYLEEERKQKENEEALRMEEERKIQAEKQIKEERKEENERKETSPRKESVKLERSGEYSHHLENSHTSSTEKETPAGGRNVMTNKEGQLQDIENGYAVSPVVLDLEPVNANILPNSLEERRLAWMKKCLPWSKISNEPWKLKSTTGDKVPRRPASAKKLPPLPENLILEAAQVASLRQVTTVELKDLPGHALAPLGSCSQLKHLTVTRCGLIALDGLSQCRHLQCLNAEDNLIEFVELKELGSLYTLNLAHNKLSSVHGLEGCTNLRWLDVSHNRLTKLAGLSPLRRLHTLQASHNQLVSTKGLETCPTIQQLDLSANYLTSVQGLEKLGLLLSLNVASNNLTQMPSLENNVLLQELVLRENSIGPDLDLSNAWLPLLFYLDLSQNIIEELTGSAGGLFVLKRLDLAVNQITDIGSFLPGLADCPRLEDLSLQGNAVLDEESFTENVKNSMSSLLCLNGETLRSQASQASAGRHVRAFELLCLTQLQLHRDIKDAFDKDCRSVPDEGTAGKHHLCDTYFKLCEKSFKTAVEHRYVHEYGELSSSNIPIPPHTPRPPSAQTPRASGHTRNRVNVPPANSVVGNEPTPHRNDKENSPPPQTSSMMWGVPKNSASTVLTDENHVSNDTRKSPSPVLTQKEKFDLALQAEANSVSAMKSDQAQVLGRVGGMSVFSQAPREGWGKPAEEKDSAQGSFSGPSDAGGHCTGDKPEKPEPPQLSAKEKFERALMGLPSTPSPLPPVVGPHHNVNGQSSVSAEKLANSSPKKQSTITADLVGDLMMSETAALSRPALPNKFLEEEDDLDDLEELMEGLQFDIDGFLDLDQFDFDEDFLEKGWRPEDTPQMPQKIPSSSSKPPLPPVQKPHTPYSPAPPPPGQPAQAWHNSDTPLSDIQTRVPPLRPPSSVGSGEDSQAITTGRARKEERLAEEWGFKDSRTAELMMQRANKMKYNAERRRKLSKLDPQQRLRLFRKLEEAKGVRAVRPPPARVLPRKEYFQAREEEALQRNMEKQMEYRTKAGRTFEWLHTQVGDYDVSSSRINPGVGGGPSKPLMKTASDSQLSHHASPSPHGYSPDMDSASNYAGPQQAGRQQRHSLAGEELHLTGHSPLLPPITTSSASSQHSREREKISWRTEPTEKNVGWGGGKKRLVRK